MFLTNKVENTPMRCQKTSQGNRSFSIIQSFPENKIIQVIGIHNLFIDRNLHIKRKSLPNVSVKNSCPVLSVISKLQENFKPYYFCPAKEIFHKDIFSDLENLHFHQLLCCQVPRLVSLPPFTNYICDLKTKAIPAHFFCCLEYYY